MVFIIVTVKPNNQIGKPLITNKHTFDQCQIKLGFMETVYQKLSCTLFKVQEFKIKINSMKWKFVRKVEGWCYLELFQLASSTFFPKKICLMIEWLTYRLTNFVCPGTMLPRYD